jgi:hypothetical protein
MIASVDSSQNWGWEKRKKEKKERKKPWSRSFLLKNLDQKITGSGFFGKKFTFAVIEIQSNTILINLIIFKKNGFGRKN